AQTDDFGTRPPPLNLVLQGGGIGVRGYERIVDAVAVMARDGQTELAQRGKDRVVLVAGRGAEAQAPLGAGVEKGDAGRVRAPRRQGLQHGQERLADRLPGDAAFIEETDDAAHALPPDSAGITTGLDKSLSRRKRPRVVEPEKRHGNTKRQYSHRTRARCR